MNTDQIVKQVVLHATRKRVWDAIADPHQFGTWFGVELDNPFVPGHETVGRIVPTKVDPEVAKLQEPLRGTAFRMKVERVDPMRLFSFRWHPFAGDPNKNYDAEPMTLVSFELTDIEAGILLTITETGFDQLPLDRRDTAWKANNGGWEHTAKLIDNYLTQCEE
jgi:uncharacterized protein YndB with AHSA1/START domain